MITINNKQSAPEQVVGITNLTSGLSEYKVPRSKSSEYLYASSTIYVDPSFRQRYKNCVIITPSGEVQTALTEYDWSDVVFTRSTKSITLSN